MRATIKEPPLTRLVSPITIRFITRRDSITFGKKEEISKIIKICFRWFNTLVENGVFSVLIVEKTLVNLNNTISIKTIQQRVEIILGRWERKVS